LGALAGRAYIQAHGDLLSGLIASGNPGYSPAAPLGVRLAKYMQRRRGARAMCRPLTYGMLIPFILRSRSFTSKNSWVCGDRDVVRAYDADPLCGFEFTANGYEALLTLMARACDPKAPAPNTNLPITFFSGAKDPVMAGERALRHAAKLLVDAGYKSVEVKLYPGLGHEIMNECGKERVWQDMAKTIDQWIEN
jgi:alpha-beta hydrolase superfamily lysophospholipase